MSNNSWVRTTAFYTYDWPGLIIPAFSGYIIQQEGPGLIIPPFSGYIIQHMRINNSSLLRVYNTTGGLIIHPFSGYIIQQRVFLPFQGTKYNSRFNISSLFRVYFDNSSILSAYNTTEALIFPSLSGYIKLQKV